MFFPNQHPKSYAVHLLFGGLLPLVLWMTVIYFASTPTFSADNTSPILRHIFTTLFRSQDESLFLKFQFTLRKLSHFTEYAILALLSARFFLMLKGGRIRRAWFYETMALVTICALLDEFHQSFVPVRTASVRDSMIDIVGGAFALGLFWLWRSSRVLQD